MPRQLLLLILSLTTLSAAFLGNTELEDCFGCLESENIKCRDGSTPAEAIDTFIKEENCLYQFYMDKLYELDCIIKQNLAVPEDESNTLWQTEVMTIRNQFYNTTEVVVDKICNNCDKDDPFGMYIECMKDYWKSMKQKAEAEITQRTDTATRELYENCALLGKKHELFCNNI